MNVPAAPGRYLYGDYCAGLIRSVGLLPGFAHCDPPASPHVPGLTSFGEDAHGDVYSFRFRARYTGCAELTTPRERLIGAARRPAGRPMARSSCGRGCRHSTVSCAPSPLAWVWPSHTRFARGFFLRGFKPADLDAERPFVTVSLGYSIAWLVAVAGAVAPAAPTPGVSSFARQSEPSVRSFSPSTLALGQKLTIRGRGFLSSFGVFWRGA